MPLPMVHLNVASEINRNKKIKIYNLPDYYLGSIAPDAVHMDANYSYDKKIASHLNARTIANIDFVSSFFKEYIITNYDFILGYTIHVLTDIYWMEEIYKPFKERYLKDPSPQKNEAMSYYNDADIIDLDLYDSMPNRTQVWKYLQESKPYTIKGVINSNDICNWNQRVQSFYDENQTEYDPIKYLNQDEVVEFIIQCSGKITEFLFDNVYAM